MENELSGLNLPRFHPFFYAECGNGKTLAAASETAARRVGCERNSPTIFATRSNNHAVSYRRPGQ